MRIWALYRSINQASARSKLVSSLWSETDLIHRQAIALAYDHLPLQSWIVSSRVLNALLSYNHKLTIGDIIRSQASLGDIEGLGTTAIREFDIRIANLLDNTECTAHSEPTSQRYILALSDTIGQLPLGLLHLDMKTYQALIHYKILTISSLYQIESSLLKDISGFHRESLSNINSALIIFLNAIQQDETIDWFTYCSARNIVILPLNSNNATPTNALLTQTPKLLEEIFARENDTLHRLLP